MGTQIDWRNRNKLTFKGENITVDGIVFKFQNVDNFVQTKLAEYLFKIGFNESGKLAKPIKESLSGISKNKFRVRFGHEVWYWKDTSVYFSGASTTFFHSLVKQTSINWEFFLVLLKKGDIQIRTGE